VTTSRIDLDAIFERAPLLARRVQGDDAGAIVASARLELAHMKEAERIAVLNAHPRIGASTSALSALSRREQGDDADLATARELDRLNDEYERRFGFRFVVFVRGRTKREILAVLRERIRRTRDEELATGVEEFLAITKDRLENAPR
jgi:2-oxo-4-hydroxy-4-carboxy--5-ureidoimidazoline (OHCU) decarboxylase